MPAKNPKDLLVQLLQAAYSGEQAAAFAYRGHAVAVDSTAERMKIRQIEDEEWGHRAKVGRMLKTLGAKPSRWREFVTWTIGKTLGFLCAFTGWFLPMFFAGRLETKNVQEYDVAADYAEKLGLADFVVELREMSAVEAEHEVFFSQIVSNHWMLPWVKRIFR